MSAILFTPYEIYGVLRYITKALVFEKNGTVGCNDIPTNWCSSVQVRSLVWRVKMSNRNVFLFVVCALPPFNDTSISDVAIYTLRRKQTEFYPTETQVDIDSSHISVHEVGTISCNSCVVR